MRRIVVACLIAAAAVPRPASAWFVWDGYDPFYPAIYPPPVVYAVPPPAYYPPPYDPLYYPPVLYPAPYPPYAEPPQAYRRRARPAPHARVIHPASATRPAPLPAPSPAPVLTPDRPPGPPHDVYPPGE